MGSNFKKKKFKKKERNELALVEYRVIVLEHSSILIPLKASIFSTIKEIACKERN
jgi:hypothetical protein